eukprot:Gb_32447 [translate_table: standard]
MVSLLGLIPQLQRTEGTAKTTAGALENQGIGNCGYPKDVRSLCLQGRLKEALHILHVMDRSVGISTYVSLLQVCINKKALSEGKLVHTHINLRGFMPDRYLGNTLVHMYVKFGSLLDARRVFNDMPKRDVFSWTVMIAAYSRYGFANEALALFHQMQQTDIKPNHFTFVSVLPACANMASLEQGKEIHDKITRSGLDSNVFVGNTLIGMYAKCRSLDMARNVFDKMPQRDVVSWNSMIAPYTRHGHFEEALKLFAQMRRADIQPDEFTFASVLPACATLAALEQGKEIHEEIIKGGFQSDAFVEGALVDMYAKCGSLEIARDLFDKMHQPDVVSWTAMIAGYGMLGCGKEALKLFEEMQHSGRNPNHVTLVCVLSACCHAGLVNEGRHYFNCMSKCYNITPTMEHYVCMVDLLSRAGRLDEAQDFIDKIPIKPDATVWRCLLAACRVHNNVELGEQVAKRLFELNPKNAAPYVLLSNIYAAAGRWDDSENMRRMMKDRRVEKTPGCSWVEVNKQIHTFLVGDRSHPQTQEIYANLDRLSRQIKAAGYMPDTRFVLHNVEEEQKEQIVWHHSEKLAIAFGLINMTPGTVVRVIKNLRVCSDCHSATKFISKIVAREIVIRDASRYHHFKDGLCSCGDYW